MTSSTETVRRLAAMTDAAAFERIAAAVLRESDPSLYRSISHPGVQPGGKTVKAPFDNIGWLNQPNGQPRLVCAAHTTEQHDLTGKWLHNPSTVKVRKPGGKPTKSAGDLVKGIEEIEELRKATPGLEVTFALTTNLEVSLELLVAAKTMAGAAKVDLDVWSVSRIAHFLDTDPKGQLIRRSQLGAPVELLSLELLLDMGRRSFRDHIPHALVEDAIHRDNFVLGRADSLVVGDSGMGKSTACAAVLSSRIEGGLPAIVVPAEYLDAAPTFEEALDRELRRQEPGLEPAAGAKAVSLCTVDAPMFVLLEDVNRSPSPGRLLNKILAWVTASSGAGSGGRGWRVVCPIWPRHIDAIEDQKSAFKVVEVLRIDRYSQSEAVRAIMTRATALGVPMDEGGAATVASRLGCDPLLIGLHDLQSEAMATGVIRSYVDERLRVVSIESQVTPTETVDAVHRLLRHGLERRNLSPNWDEIRTWIQEKEVIHTLRCVFREGSVIRLSCSEKGEVIAFRHDRVMHALASGAVAEVLGGQPPEYVADPFFAELVAGAAVQVNLPEQALLTLTVASPVVAAHALKLASEQDSPYADVAAQALEGWLLRPETADKLQASRRYAVASVLAETTSLHVLRLAEQFPRDDSLWWDPLWVAAFRNGDLRSGFAFLSRFDLGMTVAGKHSLLSLVTRTYGDSLVDAIGENLQRLDLDQFRHHGVRTGALRLAGYVGAAKLAPAIRACWERDTENERDLRSYLFAAARCCGDEAAATLDPILDAWETIPDDPDSTIGQPINRVASEGVSWEFRHYPPYDAVSHFIARATTSARLAWPITYMLRTVDHPQAVEHVARYAASRASDIFIDHLLSDWQGRSSSPARQMSSASKDRLLNIALAEHEAENVRRQAFSFWDRSAAPTDLPALRSIPEGSLLFERALRARARRRDYSITPHLLLKIKEDPDRWISAGLHIWSSLMTEALESALDQLAAKPDGEGADLGHEVASAMIFVDPARRVAMLSARWARLKTIPEMVQVALLTVGPAAAALVQEAIAGAPNPGTLLKYLAVTATMTSNGRRPLETVDQLRNLVPVMQHLSDGDIVILSATCEKNGWADFRRQHLEPRLGAMPNRSSFLTGDPVDLSALDKTLKPEPGVIVSLHRWLENSVRRGMGRGALVKELMQWLRTNHQERAIQIVGGIISAEGTRNELLLFEETAKQLPDASALLEAVRFDVFRRSLA
ncbi:hypothetical protein [Paracidovorax avenae]|nr:hypothetical protein [Paracidovorax avenae]